ncbi:MAG: MFS transporter [Hydrogenophilaceae bacterium]|nr:MFS transporter [Hydrogenophilaceae bacterium]
MTDRHLIYLASFLRAVATGLIGVLLGLYLARLAFGPSQIGLTVSAGLAGATLAVFLVGLRGDRWGRRRTLMQLSWLAVAGGLGALIFSELTAILIAAFVGMLNGQGRDRGASLVLEQAILPSTTTDAERTRAFAWYNVLQDIGHAVGSGLAALPAWLVAYGELPDLAAFKLAIGLYVVLFVAQALLFSRLSPRIEEAQAAKPAPLSPDSRRRLTRISALFAIDAVAGGFLGAALIAYFFHARFGVDAQTIAALFVGARILNAVSHLGAAWLAKRIGLVNTMVFTHIPSSLLLASVAIAPDFPTAAILFLLREGLVEMDVPTRQSYVMAMVRPDERTFASSVTHLVRLGGWAVAPGFAGLLMQTLSLGTPLIVGAAMKIGYDGLLWASFRRIKPPEEAH